MKPQPPRQRQRTLTDEHFLVLELGGNQQGATVRYGWSWLEAIEWECGYTPVALEDMRKRRATGMGWGPEDEAHFAPIREEARRREVARPRLHGPVFDPRLHNAGYHLADLATRVRGLLADGQWHSYPEVAALFTMERYPERNDFYEVLTWGDDPDLRDWQVAVCCTGRMDTSGRFVLWDSPVARLHRAQYDSALQRERAPTPAPYLPKETSHAP